MEEIEKLLRPDEILLTIDCRSLNQMIAAGNYGWVQPGINSLNFPWPEELNGRTIKRIVKILNPGKFLDGFETESYVKGNGYEPGSFLELLGLGVVRPELQRQFHIAAPGTVWQPGGNYGYMTDLRGLSGQRALCLLWLGARLGPGYCLLGSRPLPD